MHDTLQRHRYKILVGVPIVVLLASSLSLIRPENLLATDPAEGKFIAAGATTTIRVIFDTKTPINAVGGTIHIPTDSLAVVGISGEDSAIDLWSEQPTLSEDGSKLHFSGGIVSENGIAGSGPVLSFSVRALKPGVATVRFTEGELLAHDGIGTNVLRTLQPVKLVIRESSNPSPDVNGDMLVSIADFGIVSAKLFGTYEERYDLDGDGKITLTDLYSLVRSYLQAR